MARIELAPEVLDDFDRFLDHLAKSEVADAAERVAAIVRGLDVLAHSPEIGRPVRDGKRELVIGKGTRGYVALYRYVAGADVVFVLAVRAQREGAFQRR
ncbi:MAG: type II toxin-antitoxin system RelE/ParE family toxin [Burkholderiaceae bacterium]|nr:type II toxin-antitoxin system RelE/ParE family toxin [Burkholderiaceae bacterium]